MFLCSAYHITGENAPFFYFSPAIKNAFSLKWPRLPKGRGHDRQDRNFYSFTLPAEMPLMMYLEKKQNAIMMGTAEMATTR